MAAAYDDFDYPAYWLGRVYEHESEVLALNAYLAKIPKIKSICEIGAGFGRLTPYYVYRAKRVVLTEPSAKLLHLARQSSLGRPDHRHNEFLQTSIENLPQKFGRARFDLVILVRVMHHLKDTQAAFAIIHKILNKKGYLILEFPNKLHGKAVICNFLKGNFTFPLEIFPFDKRSKKAIKDRTLPFFNYHPEIIQQELKAAGFTVVEKRSVSNIRNETLKRNLPISFLLWTEQILQRVLAFVNFGPSIFILAKKG
jgi:SAM-dependent methyltransferase